MRYPVITRSKCEVLVRQLLREDHPPNWELERQWVGSGPDLDLTLLRRLVSMMKEDFEKQAANGRSDSPEVFEGRYSGGVHFALRDLPMEVLDDPGFWRYLALTEFWWFVVVREAGALSRGNIMGYVDGGRESVPFRMFLRAQAIRDDDDYSLAAALPHSADFWRSHILRVRTGTVPALARAFVRLQVEKQMVAGDVRPFAKRLNRLWTNIVFHLWDEEECYQLLSDLYQEMYGARGSADSGADAHRVPST